MKPLRKLRNAWVILLIIFSMLLSGCGQVADNTPEQDGGNNELSDFVNDGFYFPVVSADSGFENNGIYAAFQSNRTFEDASRVTVAFYFGFDFPTVTNIEDFRRENGCYKNAEIYLSDGDGNEIHVRTTEDYFTSENYICNVWLDKASDTYVTAFHHMEWVTVPEELLSKGSGIIHFTVAADREGQVSVESAEEHNFITGISLYYEKDDNGKIIIYSDDEIN